MEQKGQLSQLEFWVDHVRQLLRRGDAAPRNLIIAALSFVIRDHPDTGVELVKRLHREEAVPPDVLAAVAHESLTQLLACKRPKEAADALELFLSWKVDVPPHVVREIGEQYLEANHLEKAGELAAHLGASRSHSYDAVKLRYAIAKKEGRVEDAHRSLTQLVEVDCTPATAAYAYRERAKLPLGPGKPVRVAILSSYVLDNLTHYLDFECRKAGLRPEFYIAPFNQYSQEILNQGSGLYGFDPEVIFLAIGLEDIVPELTELPSVEVLHGSLETVPSRILGLLQELEQRSKALIVLHEFSPVFRSLLGILDQRSPNGVAEFAAKMNRQIREGVGASSRTFLLPLGEVIGWIGLERAHDPKLHYLASMKLSGQVLPYLAQYSMRYVKPLKGVGRKCIVLDLDGTLWGGIVGEVGIDGIHLGPAAPGKEFVEFQKALAALASKGIILAICSKNNREDVLPVLRSHKYMVLREERFAAMRINWSNKADNIRDIARELNIGLESMVFMDDNPVERELVRQVLPEVLTVDMPKDPSRYRSTLESMTDFELLSMTQEDAARGQQYQAMAQRQAAKGRAESLDAYLHSLDIQVDIARADDDQAPRLVQLFNKTNQFNLTTRRYQASDVERFLRSPEYRLYAMNVKDRFGDHGLVGTALVAAEGAAWRIDSFLMSCRVMGLAVETALLERLGCDAIADGKEMLVGEFVPTQKNQPAKNFYRQHGFTLSEESEGAEKWTLDLKSSVLRKPDWIK